MSSSAQQVFSKALKLSLILVLAVAAVGSGLGLVFAGLPGVWSALIGSGIALVFSALTILSIWIGGRLPLAGFYGLVLGGWIFKFVLFAVAVALLQRADFISGPVLFFAIVAAVLGGLAIDSFLVLKARIPVVEN